MIYPDTVKLVETTSDMYGDRTATELIDVAASFVKRSGYLHGDHTEGETSDAAVYLLPTDETVLSRMHDLEGTYIVSEPFSEKNWYRISSVNIARRKLLNNAIDNIYCRLEKVAGLPYVRDS